MNNSNKTGNGEPKSTSLNQINSFKYERNSRPPYVVHVQSTDTEKFIHPLLIAKIIMEICDSDIIEIKKMERGQVLVELCNYETANNLASNPTLASQKLRAFIPIYCTFSNKIKNKNSTLHSENDKKTNNSKTGNGEPELNQINNSKYERNSRPPYVVHVQSTDIEKLIHPLLIAKMICTKICNIDDIIEIKKMDYGHVLVELCNYKAANNLVSNPILASQKLKAFIPIYCTFSNNKIKKTNDSTLHSEIAKEMNNSNKINNSESKLNQIYVRYERNNRPPYVVHVQSTDTEKLIHPLFIAKIICTKICDINDIIEIKKMDHGYTLVKFCNYEAANNLASNPTLVSQKLRAFIPIYCTFSNNIKKNKDSTLHNKIAKEMNNSNEANKSEPKSNQINNAKYERNNRPPYVVHVQSTDTEKFIHPLLIAKIITEICDNDIIEIKKIGRGHVLVEFYNYKAANSLVSNPTLASQKLRAFVPIYCTISNNIKENKDSTLHNKNAKEMNNCNKTNNSKSKLNHIYVKYERNSRPPYVVHVQSTEKLIHPLYIAKIICTEICDNNDIIEIKKMGLGHVLVEFYNYKAANDLASNSTLASQKLKAFIPTYRALRTDIFNNVKHPEDKSCSSKDQSIRCLNCGGGHFLFECPLVEHKIVQAVATTDYISMIEVERRINMRNVSENKVPRFDFQNFPPLGSSRDHVRDYASSHVLLASCMPRSVLSRRTHAPWWNAECQEAFNKRKDALETWKHYPIMDNLILYKKESAICKKVFRRAKRASGELEELYVSASIRYFIVNLVKERELCGIG